MSYEYSFMYGGCCNQERGQKECILSAALELFAEKGFHGTAVPEIAAKAGVAAGTIYRYFDSKEAMVNAVYQRHKARCSRPSSTTFLTRARRGAIHHFISRVFVREEAPFGVQVSRAASPRAVPGRQEPRGRGERRRDGQRVCRAERAQPSPAEGSPWRSLRPRVGRRCRARPGGLGKARRARPKSEVSLRGSHVGGYLCRCQAWHLPPKRPRSSLDPTPE